MTEDEWIEMWDNTKYEMTRADANFRIDWSFQEEMECGSVNSGSEHDTIVDSNKRVLVQQVSNSVHRRTYYLLCEYDFYYSIRYEEHFGFVRGRLYPSSKYFETMGERIWYYNLTKRLQFLYENFRDDFSFVNYLGNGKYAGSFINDFRWWDWNHRLYIEFFITVSNRMISQLSFKHNSGHIIRTDSYDIILGGQSIVLPNYNRQTRLSSPANLQINGGILTWDEVESAGGFWIYVENSYVRRRFAVASPISEVDLFERLYSMGFDYGMYRTSIVAGGAVFLYLSSLPSEPIYFYFTRNYTGY